tara:strand:+ start:8445 stop:8669 length:225 start_codon:yes stop_codon:yes gene_type:complete
MSWGELPAKVSGHPDLHRDASTGAIVNTDKQAFEAYKRQRQLSLQSTTNAEDLQSLRQEMDEIKGLLKDVLSKL